MCLFFSSYVNYYHTCDYESCDVFHVGPVMVADVSGVSSASGLMIESSYCSTDSSSLTTVVRLRDG